MFGKLSPTKLSAAIAGGVMLCMSSAANAGFVNMEYICSYDGPISVPMPCGPTVKPDSIGVPLDGHIEIATRVFQLSGTEYLGGIRDTHPVAHFQADGCDDTG